MNLPFESIYIMLQNITAASLTDKIDFHDFITMVFMFLSNFNTYYHKKLRLMLRYFSKTVPHNLNPDNPESAVFLMKSLNFI